MLPDPKPLAVAGPLVVVGSQGSGELESLGLDDGRALASIGPRPGTPIVGGHTEPHAADVMGGKAPRALLWSPRLGKLFVTSIGPNVGPNPQRMEVSMNGGVGVVDLGARRFERHLGFGAGVTEGMALDEETGRLYVADTGLGLVRAVDASALAAGDAPARKSELWRLAVLPPTGFPLARDTADYGVNGRAGVELHSGPRALVLSASGTELYVLDRFTATVAVVEDVRSARPRVSRQIALETTPGPRERRLGQVLYFADMGRSGMSCDSCHLEGHDEGILFEKTHPLRIYRSPTVRGTRETPPYFTPASTFSLAETARMVGDRNRYMNPDPDRVRGSAAHALQRDGDQPAQPLPRPGRRAAGDRWPCPEEAPAGRWRDGGSSRGRRTASGAIRRRSSPPTRTCRPAVTSSTWARPARFLCEPGIRKRCSVGWACPRWWAPGTSSRCSPPDWPASARRAAARSPRTGCRCGR